MRIQRIYPSKVLLFGEYTVLHGSQALAIPYPGRSGQWEKNADSDQEYASLFNAYLTWLKTPVVEQQLEGRLDVSQMETDFAEHWKYTANIPEGYGLGSSGALCAAILDRYATDLEHLKKTAQLRKTLALLESFFHGKSSGIDPYVSFVSKPVLRLRDQSLKILEPIRWPDGWNVCLVDSGTSRVTSEWVAIYQAKCRSADYERAINHYLVPDVEHAIHFTLLGSWEQAWQHLANISLFQAEHMNEMIIPPMHDLWESCMKTDICRMKLCGAGGGGYYLLFSRDRDGLKNLLADYDYLQL